VRSWRYPSQGNFFGLGDEYIENVYEQFFVLKHHGGWSFWEAYNLPIKLRLWFVQRLSKHFEDEKEEYEKAKRKK
jgi:hypothetical protein